MKAHKRRRRIVIVCAIVLGVIVAVTGILIGIRGALASAVAARGLARAGLHCDHVDVRVPLALPVSTVQLAPMRCTSGRGPIASIQFETPLQVSIAGTRLRSVSVASIEVDFRAQRRQVTMNALGDLSRVAGLDRSGFDLLLDWAALSREPLPPFAASRVTVHRAGHNVAEVRDLRLRPDGNGQSISAADVHLEQFAILGTATLMGHSTSERSRVTLVVAGALRIEVTGRHLDSARPNIDLALGIAAAQR